MSRENSESCVIQEAGNAMILRELKKLSDFLQTPVPYLSGFLGILCAMFVLGDSVRFGVDRFKPASEPVIISVTHIDEGEPKFDLIYMCSLLGFD